MKIDPRVVRFTNFDRDSCVVLTIKDAAID